jgi:hypothetical protein
MPATTTLPRTPTTRPTTTAAGAVHTGHGGSSDVSERRGGAGAGTGSGWEEVTCGGGTLDILRSA